MTQEINDAWGPIPDMWSVGRRRRGGIIIFFVLGPLLRGMSSIDAKWFDA